MRTYALLLALVATVALGQQHPNAERGRPPGAVFQDEAIDAINLFNGNLTATIPLSQTYRVGPTLSYSFALRYTGNVWDYEQQCYGGSCYTQAIPDRRSNAGMGWRLSMGRLIPPTDVTNETGSESLWVYESPDGHDHVFYPTLHEETPVTGVWYSRNGTYLRLRQVGATYLIDFPDGTTHTFDSDGYLMEMRDAVGNYVRHNYTWGIEGLVRWTITDGNTTEGDTRTHSVDYTIPSVCSCGGPPFSCSYQGQLPTTVTLASFNGQQTVWTLSYTSTCIARGHGHNDPNVSSTARMFFLTEARVTQPSTIQQRYAMTQDVTIQSYVTSGFATGLLQRLELPTAGRIEWSFALNSFNTRTGGVHRYQIPGVSQRRLVDAGGQIVGTWTHAHNPASAITCGGDSSGPRYISKDVTDPAGNTTAHYFSTYWLNEGCTNAEGWTPYEYGLPIGRQASHGSRYVSTIALQAGTTPKRSTYLLFERDATGGGAPGTTLSYIDANQRLKGSRVVFDDDAGRYADDERSNFDGLGHYRTSVTSGTFGAGNDRTTTINFNPSAGTYPGSFTIPSSSGPWVLGTYDFEQATEGSFTEKRTYCFDATRGSLLRKRTLAGTTEAANDLVTRYTYAVAGQASPGQRIREEYFGGDVQVLGTGNLCSLSLPAPQYRIDHTHQYGTLETSRYVDSSGNPLSFYTVNQDIDPNTGLVVRSRDTSGIITNYEYDGLGRLTLARPETGHGAATKYIFTQGTATSSPTQVVQVWNNALTTLLRERQSIYDRFGRLVKEKGRYPTATGLAWNTTRTTYNALGWTTAVSSTEAADPPVHETLYVDHDMFGRPGKIRPPDGDLSTRYHVTTLAYQGARIVQRTSSVRTGGDATNLVETPVTRTEEHDRQGRLWKVTEPSGPNNELVTTTCTYDVANRLRQVSMQGTNATQTRTFNYDGRGFLLSKTEPEIGA
ncbi:MAG: hypothetical protein ACRD2J_06700, partial [Thermoanaerobaculia bacterium]